MNKLKGYKEIFRVPPVRSGKKPVTLKGILMKIEPHNCLFVKVLIVNVFFFCYFFASLLP